MDDMSVRIRRFLAAADAACATISGLSPVDITIRDIEQALAEVCDLDHLTELLNAKWTPDSIVERLRDYDFRRLRHKTVDTVRLQESIVPDGVLRLLTEERIRQRGEVWEVHKNDADPFPSNPHAHNYQSGHTLHLGNGDLYLRRKLVGKIRQKNLVDLRKRIRSVSLPPLEVQDAP